MQQTNSQASVKAVICIPTFRRPEWLARTLASVTAQETNFGFAIVVVDNDAGNPVGATRAHVYLSDTAHSFQIFVEERQGNCHAINRAFGEAMAAYPDAEFFLMIDDDEMAEPGWLAAIVSEAEEGNADIVGGPVVREFEVPVSHAVRKHLLFQSLNGPSGAVPQIHGSGNCLIRRRVFAGLASPLFDISFNFLGGGDMEFFTRCRRAGFKSRWCAEARVREFVAAERVTAHFLMTRSIRTGSINYVIDRIHGPSAMAVVSKNVVSLGLGVVRSLVLLIRTRHVLPATHPILMSFGRISASLGFLPAPYKASNNHL